MVLVAVPYVSYPAQIDRASSELKTSLNGLIARGTVVRQVGFDGAMSSRRNLCRRMLRLHLGYTLPAGLCSFVRELLYWCSYVGIWGVSASIYEIG